LLELEPVVKAGTMSLVQAVELPSPRLFRALLSQGARTDYKDDGGNTLLMLAARRHHVTALAALLAAGLDANARNAAGETPLAIASGKSEYELMVVGIGLALGQDQASLTRLVFRPAQKSNESAATARRLEAAKLLLSAKADPNAADGTGGTPLLQATRSGDVELVRMLISAGAQVDRRDAAGNAPLLVAARYGLQEIAASLLDAHASASLVDAEGHTPLELARAGGHANLVKLLEGPG
jgi:ankyrin repeat protein